MDSFSRDPKTHSTLQERIKISFSTGNSRLNTYKAASDPDNHQVETRQGDLLPIPAILTPIEE